MTVWKVREGEMDCKHADWFIQREASKSEGRQDRAERHC